MSGDAQDNEVNGVNGVNGANDATAVPGAPSTPARNRRAVALVAGGVGLALLAGGALWAVGRIADADRTAPTRYWVADGPRPVPTGPASPRASIPPNELTGKLLPIPTGYVPGPDLDEEGNDFYVPGERALQAFKDAHTGLSGDQKAERDKALADLRLKGMAGRSYLLQRDHLVVEIHLTQADPQALARFSEFSKKVMALLGDDRDAPKVDGFPDARCVRQAVGKERKEEKDKIDTLECEALQGDVLVSFRAYEPKPFSTNDAVGLFKQQLNHLKSPGESV